MRLRTLFLAMLFVSVHCSGYAYDWPHFPQSTGQQIVVNAYNSANVGLNSCSLVPTQQWSGLLTSKTSTSGTFFEASLPNSTATFTPDIKTTGNYDVFVHWPVGNWDKTVPFTVNCATVDAGLSIAISGTLRENTNQGRNTYVGTFHFVKGSGNVVLSTGASGVSSRTPVPADSIKLFRNTPAIYYPASSQKVWSNPGKWLLSGGYFSVNKFTSFPLTLFPQLPVTGNYDIYVVSNIGPHAAGQQTENSANIPVEFDDDDGANYNIPALDESTQTGALRWNWIGNGHFTAGNGARTYGVSITRPAWVGGSFRPATVEGVLFAKTSASETTIDEGDPNFTRLGAWAAYALGDVPSSPLGPFFGQEYFQCATSGTAAFQALLSSGNYTGYVWNLGAAAKVSGTLSVAGNSSPVMLSGLAAGWIPTTVDTVPDVPGTPIAWLPIQSQNFTVPNDNTDVAFSFKRLSGRVNADAVTFLQEPVAPPPVIGSIALGGFGGSANVVTVNLNFEPSIAASDPLGLPVSYLWSVISGPSDAKFSSSSNNPSPDIMLFTPNAPYTLRVVVTNAYGISSTASVIVTPVPQTLPTVVTAVPIAGGASLSWNAIPGASLYTIEYGTSSGNYTASVNVTGTTDTLTNLNSWDTYYIIVQAIGAPGGTSTSSEVSVVPGDPPDAPSNLTAQGGAQTSLAWSSVPHVDSYTIKRGTVSGQYTASIPGIANTNYVDNPGAPGLYYYVVSATSAFGESPNSTEVLVHDGSALGSIGLTGTAYDREIDLTWNAVPGATAYFVSRGTASHAYTQCISVGSNLTCQDLMVQDGVSYYYCVSAIVSGNQTADSGEISVEYPLAGYPVLRGFNQNSLAANDDYYTGLVALPFQINFLGTQANSIYVNNNGNITFANSLGTYTPEPIINNGVPIIAPFWADVDTRDAASGIVNYGTGSVNGRSAFGVTWPYVGYYDYGTDKLNNFQLVLIDRSDVNYGDFDIEFNYTQVQWETGYASGGGHGLGGQSARVGLSDGQGVGFELPGSAVNGAFLDNNQRTGLIHGSVNSGILGRYIFQIRSGKLVGLVLVSAGPNQTVSLQQSQGAVNLAGSVTNPNGIAVTYNWSVVISPGGSNTSFSNSLGLATIFKFDATGTYQLSLAASSTNGTSFSNVTINVTSTGTGDSGIFNFTKLPRRKVLPTITSLVPRASVTFTMLPLLTSALFAGVPREKKVDPPSKLRGTRNSTKPVAIAPPTLISIPPLL